MKAAVTDSSCIFCKIISGAIPSHKLFENDHVFAFLDINPIAHGHALVIPKYHAMKVHEVPGEYMAEVGTTLARVAKAIGAEDYNILQNNGRAAHQAVFHVHFHIIPKKAGEGLGIVWNPIAQPTKEELSALADQVRSKI